jgi:hypothetical protein
MTQPLPPLLVKQSASKPEPAGRFGVSGVAVFGSYARGEERPESDLDLLIDFADAARARAQYQYIRRCGMNPSVNAAVIVVLTSGSAGMAHSGPFLSPSNTGFALNGMLTFESSNGEAPCKVLFSGRTSTAGSGKKHAGEIVLADAFGKCSREPKFTNVPWKIRLQSKAGGVVSNMSYFFEAYPCGYDVPITISKRGVWSFNGTKSGCNIQGSLKSTPPITIAK